MKQSIKVLLSVILIACITISYALAPVIASNFTDTKAHWANEKIEKWTSSEILSGSNNKFRPNDYITRGEIAVILNKIMRYQNKAENSFKDLDEKFYTDAILKANFAGVLSGNNKKIRPADKATREEAAVMFVKALSIKLNENKDYLKFKDSSQISNWAVESVNAMSGNGYVKGNSKIEFNPKSKITRGEVVAIIDNCIQALYGKEGTYSEKTINGNALINTPEVTLKDMQINGNLIIAQGVGEGSVHLDNVKINGDILVKGGSSVYFNNVSVAGSLIVNKTGGQIKIVSSGTTTIERAILESGAAIEAAAQVTGGINSVEISSRVPTGQKVILQGVFKFVTNNAINMCIEAVGTIDNLILNQKTIVTGGANIKSITTAKGADSVINGIFVAGGQTNISLADQTTAGDSDTVAQNSGGNSNNNNNNNIKKYTVTFQSNGGTATAPLVVSNGSKLTLPTAPAYTGYVFMGWFTDTELTSQFRINTTVSSNITLYAKWNGFQKPIIIDERFETGYPKFSVTADKKIKLVVKLKDASSDNPVDVYMLVNQMNSLFDATSEEVMHGHCGAVNGLVEVDEAPFIKISDTNEHEIETQVLVKGNNNIKMYFALKDKAGIVSQEPTVIVFQVADVSEKDTSAPELYNNGVYINRANDKITLYFDEALNETSIPTPGAITLSNGTSPAAISIDAISLKNLASNKGVLELSVSGVDDSSNLSISYTKPNEGSALQDNAVTPNRVESFAHKPVKTISYNISSDNVAVSNQGQYIYIKMNFALQEYNSFDFTINKGPDAQNLTPVNAASSVLRIWSSSGNFHKMYICLDNIPSLSAGDKYYITLIPAPRDGTTATDFCGDTVTKQVNIQVAPSATQEESVLPQSISYNRNLNKITVKFPYVNDLYSDGGMFGCLFTLNIDGVSYTLRGKLYCNKGEIVISQENVPIDLTTVNWSNASLTYSLSTHNSFDSDTQMTYKSGMSFSGFTDIPITVSP